MSRNSNQIMMTITDWNDLASHDAMGPVEKNIKRLADIVCSMTALVVLFPFMFLVYLVLRLEGCKSPLVAQERVGYHACPFILYKFRTMVEDAEADGIPRLASKDDVRLTRVGRVLRNCHLDELPQLWNVLRGDMSLVGPRPERQYFIDKISDYTQDYRFIYVMRPGLTSRATIENGYTDTMEKMLKRLEMDIEYLHTRSLGGDCKLVLRTLMAMLGGKRF